MRYIIDSLWAIPVTATVYLVNVIFFDESWDNWVLLLILHAIATLLGIFVGPPFYRRWFTREK